jgi:hypothetical protein
MHTSAASHRYDLLRAHVTPRQELRDDTGPRRTLPNDPGLEVEPQRGGTARTDLHGQLLPLMVAVVRAEIALRRAIRALKAAVHGATAVEEFV